MNSSERNPSAPLRDYVQAAPDDVFAWRERERQSLAHVTLYELELTSQRWQNHVWTHRIQLFVPNAVSHSASVIPDTVLLYVTTQGGEPETELGAFMAAAMGGACAFLYDVPNQPLFDGLLEDALIAHTFAQYLETGDTTWPLLFPMVKSVTRAMDALQAFSRQEFSQKAFRQETSADGQTPRGAFSRFIVTGASKRGWTSWLTAAVDDRAQGIIPMVYDNLNLLAQMPHQVEMAGDYSASIHDYTALDLPQRMTTTEGQFLARMVDPYTFREDLTLPKLLINGANDSYWMTDALNLYWNDLPGPKSVLYIPNTGHFLGDATRLYGAMSAFVRATIAGDSLPSPALRITESAEALTVRAETDAKEAPVKEARLWTAQSLTRDFRLSHWNAQPLTQHGNLYIPTVKKPDAGYLALFGEFDFTYSGQDYKLSTPIAIVAAQEQI